MANLDELRELYELRRIAQERAGTLRLGQLEEEFLSFGQLVDERVLEVRLPRLYRLEGEDEQHVRSLSEALGIPAPATGMLDIAGWYEGNPREDLLVFVSPKQMGADHLSEGRSWLTPLLQEVYGKGFDLLSEYAIHEAVTGKVRMLAGGMPLDDILRAPHKFRGGAYELETTLDTPAGSARDHDAMHRILDAWRESPRTIGDPAKVSRAARMSASLRARIGALGRYPRIADRTFKAPVEAIVQRSEDGDRYWLRSPLDGSDLLVWFGEQPFAEGNAPRALKVVPGTDNQAALGALVAAGLCSVSPEIAAARTQALERMIDRATNVSGAGDYPTADLLLNDLRTAQRTLEGTLNPDIRRKYASGLSAEVLSTIAYPSTKDPTVHELLARCAWEPAVRQYHDTHGFTDAFTASTEEERVALLRKIAGGLWFRNQQNQTVNLWLWRHHRDECERAGIAFDVHEPAKL